MRSRTLFITLSIGVCALLLLRMLIRGEPHESASSQALAIPEGAKAAQRAPNTDDLPEDLPEESLKLGQEPKSLKNKTVTLEEQEAMVVKAKHDVEELLNQELRKTIEKLHERSNVDDRVEIIRDYLINLTETRRVAGRLTEEQDLRWDTAELSLRLIPWERFDRRHCARYRNNVYSQFSPKGESGILEAGVRDTLEFLNSVCDPKL